MSRGVVRNDFIVSFEMGSQQVLNFRMFDDGYMVVVHSSSIGFGSCQPAKNRVQQYITNEEGLLMVKNYIGTMPINELFAYGYSPEIKRAVSYAARPADIQTFQSYRFGWNSVADDGCLAVFPRIKLPWKNETLSSPLTLKKEDPEAYAKRKKQEEEERKRNIEMMQAFKIESKNMMDDIERKLEEQRRIQKEKWEEEDKKREEKWKEEDKKREEKWKEENKKREEQLKPSQNNNFDDLNALFKKLQNDDHAFYGGVETRMQQQTQDNKSFLQQLKEEKGNDKVDAIRREKEFDEKEKNIDEEIAGIKEANKFSPDDILQKQQRDLDEMLARFGISLKQETTKKLFNHWLCQAPGCACVVNVSKGASFNDQYCSINSSSSIARCNFCGHFSSMHNISPNSFDENGNIV